MPLMHVLLTPGAFDAAAQQHLARGLTDAACRAEAVPDRSGPRSRALILMQELPPGGFYSAARPAEAMIRGVFVTWQASTGVLDGRRKAGFARDLQAAAEAAAAPGDGRMVITSAVIEEVPEGQWAQTGKIRRLPEVAAIAEFEHLNEIAEGRAA